MILCMPCSPHNLTDKPWLLAKLSYECPVCATRPSSSHDRKAAVRHLHDPHDGMQDSMSYGALWLILCLSARSEHGHTEKNTNDYIKTMNTYNQPKRPSSSNAHRPSTGHHRKHMWRGSVQGCSCCTPPQSFGAVPQPCKFPAA